MEQPGVWVAAAVLTPGCFLRTRGWLASVPATASANPAPASRSWHYNAIDSLPSKDGSLYLAAMSAVDQCSYPSWANTMTYTRRSRIFEQHCYNRCISKTWNRNRLATDSQRSSYNATTVCAQRFMTFLASYSKTAPAHQRLAMKMDGRLPSYCLVHSNVDHGCPLHR